MTRSLPQRFRGYKAWLVCFGVATVFGCLYAGQVMLANVVRDKPADLAGSLVSQLAPWYAWAVLLPLIVRMCVAYPITVGRVGKAITLYAVAGIAATLIHGFLRVIPEALFMSDGTSLTQYYKYYLVNRAVSGYIDYCLVVAAVQAFLNYTRVRDRELTTAMLNARLTEAELRELKAQLNPHFLFNTLNAIAAYIRDEPAVAETMITRLSDLLRLVLQSSGEADVPVSREMEMVKNYLGIHEARFGSRLRIVCDVDSSIGDALVPSMILQPIVENAISHGVSQRPGPAVVEVTVKRVDGRTRLSVVDKSSEPGMTPVSTQRGFGMGLRNTRARLEQQFGNDYTFDLTQTTSGAVAIIDLPLRYADGGGH